MGASQAICFATFKGAAAASYPVVETTANSTQNSDVTSHPITLPSGVQVGDGLVVFFGFDGVVTASISSGTGWAIYDQDPGTSGGGALVWKVADGTDALTMDTSAAEQSAAVAYRISNFSSLTATMAENAGTNDTPPVHNPGVSDDYLWLVALMGQGGGSVPTAAPTNYTNFISAASTGGGTGSGVGTARRNLTASSETPGAFTAPDTGATRVAFTVAVAPP
jgi:hypothetical protein